VRGAAPTITINITRRTTMPTLYVSTRENVEEFPEAKSYVIDEKEMLHIVGQNGNLASFSRGEWQYVTSTE